MSKTNFDQLLEGYSGPAPGDTVHAFYTFSGFFDLGCAKAPAVVGVHETNLLKRLDPGEHYKVRVINPYDEDTGLALVSLAEVWLEELQNTPEVLRHFTVTKAVRGGYLGHAYGLRAFLPASLSCGLIEPEHSFRVKIAKVGKDRTGRPSIVVDQRAAQEITLTQVVETLEVEQIIKGTVTGIRDFGIFVKFNYSGRTLSGMIHKSHLGYRRSLQCQDVAKPGDYIEARVVQVEGVRVSLSLRGLSGSLWKEAQNYYNSGARVACKVLKVEEPFVLVRMHEMPQLVAGIHCSELKQAQPGQKLVATVKSLQPKRRLMSLTNPELQNE